MIVTERFIAGPILKAAIAVAEKSVHQHRIGCVIFKGKRVYASAFNSVRSNKIPYKFKNFLESAHAETQCIIKAKRSLKGYSILVVRLGKNGKLLMSKPCSFCQEFIDYVEMQNTFYSDDNGDIIKLT